MSARDKLDIAKPPGGQLDAVHKWMRDQKTGYHYWAGIYNNQNTYVADWFLKQYTKDDDMFMLKFKYLLDSMEAINTSWTEMKPLVTPVVSNQTPNTPISSRFHTKAICTGQSSTQQNQGGEFSIMGLAASPSNNQPPPVLL